MLGGLRGHEHSSHVRFSPLELPVLNPKKLDKIFTGPFLEHVSLRSLAVDG